MQKKNWKIILSKQWEDIMIKTLFVLNQINIFHGVRISS